MTDAVGQVGELRARHVGNLVDGVGQVVHYPKLLHLGVQRVLLNRHQFFGLAIHAVAHTQDGGLPRPCHLIDDVDDCPIQARELHQRRTERSEGSKCMRLHPRQGVQVEHFLPLLHSALGVNLLGEEFRCL